VFRAIVILVLITGCGDWSGDPKRSEELKPGANNPSVVQFDANMHTPGFFRDTYRLLGALAPEDDATAVHRMTVELQARTLVRGETPDMPERDIDTLDGLVLLALRSMQAADDEPATGRHLAQRILAMALALDPARIAWNEAHGASEQVEVLPGGGRTLAEAGLFAVRDAARGYPAVCTAAAQTGTYWDPENAEIVWVDEICEPDRWVGAYCEPDRWREGACIDVWVPEQCSGSGYWEDRGWYDYYCYSDDDCRYEWVEYWVYVDGDCSGGYYEQQCNAGYWEYGLCYDGTFVPGYCIEGHYEWRCPGGVWTFEQYLTAPSGCEIVRPSQLAISASAAYVLHAKGRDDLFTEWQVALDELIESDRLQAPDESTLDAVIQILEGALQPPPAPPQSAQG
jgi:hypothetical protein